MKLDGGGHEEAELTQLLYKGKKTKLLRKEQENPPNPVNTALS